MESSKELALIVRGLENEKLKYTISILKDIKHKINSESVSIIDNEIKKLLNQLNSNMDFDNDEIE